MKAVIVGQGNPYVKNPYLSKLAEVLDKESVGYEFWMWFREKGHEGLPKVRVLFTFGGWGGGIGSALGYLLWMARLFIAVLGSRRGTVFLCSRFDAALPCALASIFRPLDYVFLDRDKLSKSYSWPRIVKIVLENFERFVEARARFHVVPGESRISSRRRPNARIVRNTPHSAVVQRAYEASSAVPPRTGKLRVLISGLMSGPRGVAMTLEVVKSLKGSGIEFVAAGRLLGSEAHALGEVLGNCFLGEVSNEEALSLLIASDVVFAFYDPALEINRLAESNKWFDCAALGVPFVTNAGLLTTKPFTDAEACFVVDYNDSGALRELLLQLADNPQLLQEVRQSLLALRYEPWDHGMTEVIRECAAIVKPANG